MTQQFDGHSVSATTSAFIAAPHRLLIDGNWTDGLAGKTMVTSDPATGLTIASFAIGDAADIDRAVIAARQAFEGPWSRLRPPERARLLNRLARLIDDNATLFTELEIIDNGMPRFIAALNVANIAEMLDYYAGWITKIEGTTTTPPRHLTEAGGEALTYTLREPVGVVGHILPWNVPISTAMLKIAPALAAGCTMVVKPSELTPLTIQLLGQLVLDAGIPPGVLNIVHGLGADAGAALAAHPDVDKISFTGSSGVGRAIVRAAAGNFKKVSLELGGKSPVVVMPDADLAAAIPGVAMATFFLQGQNCVAGTRVFIHDDIHDEMVDGLAEFAKGMVLGHGLDAATTQGPLISENHRAKVAAYIESGREAGATLVTGGEAPNRPGWYLRPTIFTGTTPDMRIVREEIFGPVMTVQRFNTTEPDIIARAANDTVYGLAGSVWTQNLSTAHRLVARIRAGHVSINTHGAFGTSIPFGGYGQSGWGREFGREGLDAYLETKAVTARL